jgi:hypothetical protein
VRLQSTIIISRSAEQVWEFLGELTNIPRWDRGVAGVKSLSPGPMGVGSTFSTFARQQAAEESPAPGEMTYRIADIDPRGKCTVELMSRNGNARYFRNARWQFWTEPIREGTRLTCCVEFALKTRYLPLAPVLYLMRGAILRDLRGLKAAIEQASSPGPQ